MNDVKRDFWFLLFPARAGARDCQLVAAARSAQDPTSTAALGAVAIEILRSEENNKVWWSVLVSIADSPNLPRTLQCLFGISNAPAQCDQLAKFGLPVIEGQIALDRNVLSVNTFAYGRRTAGGPSTVRSKRLIDVSGIDSALAPDASPDATFNPRYQPFQTTPDLVRPDQEVIGHTLDVAPHRTDVYRGNTPVSVRCNTNLLYPDLFKLLGSNLPASALWVGNVLWARSAGEWPENQSASRTVPRSARGQKRIDRSSVFGAPSFVFEDVEIVGFRTELRPTDDDDDDTRGIHKLIRPLNFHRTDRNARNDNHYQPEDFRYRAATSTVVIELLRYGKMRTRSPLSPFRPEDFMSQHELLARVVVGRVDDDTSQARDAAIFVPTIFVDNPWSKALGRRLQGFPKKLATFHSGRGVLTMDAPDPLHTITEVHIVDLVGGSPPAGGRILKLECPDAEHGSPDQFITPPSTSILQGTLFRRSPWEQFDFDDVEFRRSFAGDIVADQFNRFRSVQVSPVDNVDLPKAWITGRCSVSDVRVAFPVGIAALQLEASTSSPPEWRDLVATMRDHSGSMSLPTGESVGISLPTGDWYRVKCSMELEIDDGLR